MTSAAIIAVIFPVCIIDGATGTNIPPLAPCNRDLDLWAMVDLSQMDMAESQITGRAVVVPNRTPTLIPFDCQSTIPISTRQCRLYIPPRTMHFILDARAFLRDVCRETSWYLAVVMGDAIISRQHARGADVLDIRCQMSPNGQRDHLAFQVQWDYAMGGGTYHKEVTELTAVIRWYRRSENTQETQLQPAVNLERPGDRGRLMILD